MKIENSSVLCRGTFDRISFKEEKGFLLEEDMFLSWIPKLIMAKLICL